MEGVEFLWKRVAISLCLLLQLFHGAIATAFNLTTIPFHKGFTPLFGHPNIIRSPDDMTVNLLLNQYTGSGFKSSDLYGHGFFSAKIKLPSDYTAGVVVAFYASNGEIFEKTHDELDFEFLGNVKGKRWRFQTNVYGNGSTSRGREERYFLWFDPSKAFHRYTILWTPTTTIFYIDEIPIREISRSDAMAGDYPSKPMSLYATIWDASDWATSGGKYKVNYKYAPFVSEFTGLVLHGCATDPIQEVSATSRRCSSEEDDQLAGTTYVGISPEQRMAMKKFRRRCMYYSYCYDTIRYPVPPPECVIDPVERLQFRDTGRLKFSLKRRRQDRCSKRRNQVSIMKSYGDEDDE